MMKYFYEQSQTKELFNIVGFAFAWTVFLFPMLYQGFSQSSAYDVYRISTTIANLGGLIAISVVVLVVRRRRTLKAGSFLFGGVLFGIGNAVTLVFSKFLIAAEWAVYLSSFLEGVGSALFFLVWIMAMARSPIRKFMRNTIISMFAGTACGLLMILLSQFASEVWAVFVFVVMVVSTVLFFLGNDLGLTEYEVRLTGNVQPTTLFPVPLPLQVTIFFMSLALTFAFSIASKGSPDLLGAFGFLMVLLAGVIVFLFLSQTNKLEARMSVICKLAGAAVVSGLLFYLGWQISFIHWANLIILIGYLSFLLCAIASLVQIALHYEMSYAFIFANGLLMVFLGCSVGNLAATWLSLFGRSDTLLIDTPVANTILLIIILAVMALGLFVFDKHQISTIWGLRTTDIATSFKVRCEAFSEHFALTQRQAEVLLLICDGKRTKQIEKELVIANGTARAHIRGIYDKCGVHSNAELLVKVQRFRML